MWDMTQNIYTFKWRVTHAMLAWLSALSADATAAQVLLGGGAGQSDEILAMRLTNATMLSIRKELIECGRAYSQK
ncbi:hypothetical protein C8F04DRAFT_1083004 [Mycena alexandri]|uniref:Uncharacterized protein n=1 Tax=Mycena alexandri TaxID=1745969 RepID=A0AAD6TAF3_9AGAR|nr:hypothetical protein C8F04DRAFT_1083004 [Mycena alexandri]